MNLLVVRKRVGMSVSKGERVSVRVRAGYGRECDIVL